MLPFISLFACLVGINTLGVQTCILLFHVKYCEKSPYCKWLAPAYFLFASNYTVIFVRPRRSDFYLQRQTSESPIVLSVRLIDFYLQRQACESAIVLPRQTLICHFGFLWTHRINDSLTYQLPLQLLHRGPFRQS